MRTERPRVLHVVSSLGTYGAEQLVLQLVRRSPPDFETAVMSIYSPDRHIADELRGLGIPLFDMHRAERFEVRLLPRMVLAMRRFRPQIVHTHTRYGKYWGRAAAVAAGAANQVYTEHDNAYEDRRPYQVANALFHPRTRAFITFSQGHRERFGAAEHVPLERIFVIPNGIERPPQPPSREAARAEIGIEEGAFVMLRAARLHASKNHALAIRALAQLPEPLRARVLLLIAGDGYELEELQTLAASLGVAQRVRFLGFRRDVATTLMAAADLCLFTSLWEGMPITMIEAMFAHLPVMTTPWQGASEMLGEGAYGIVLADFEPTTLAGEIGRAAADPDGLRDMGERAYERAQQVHTIAHTAQAHAELYRRVLQR